MSAKRSRLMSLFTLGNCAHERAPTHSVEAPIHSLGLHTQNLLSCAWVQAAAVFMIHGLTASRSAFWILELFKRSAALPREPSGTVMGTMASLRNDGAARPSPGPHGPKDAR